MMSSSHHVNSKQLTFHFTAQLCHFTLCFDNMMNVGIVCLYTHSLSLTVEVIVFHVM